jgi:hypothetical protein
MPFWPLTGRMANVQRAGPKAALKLIYCTVTGMVKECVRVPLVAVTVAA